MLEAAVSDLRREFPVLRTKEHVVHTQPLGGHIRTIEEAHFVTTKIGLLWK